MARVGGRNVWIAVPAGMLCAAIVGALVWLALPMVPVAITWVGDSLRRATSPAPVVAPTATPAEQAIADGTVDCRTLFPDDLWNELTWNRSALLSQTEDPPATEVTSLTAAVGPDVLVTCEWRVDEGERIVTTLAAVTGDARTIADAALRGQGFACEADDEQLVCSRTRGSVVEEQTVRDGLWLVSVETAWHPEDFGTRLDRNVFG